MGLAKLQKFIQYLRANNVMAQEDVLRAVRQMSAFDRRIGHLGAFRGFIQPEQINLILAEQAKTGDRFGDCAVRLSLMSNQQVEVLLRLQKDDLFLFAQAAVTQKLTSTEKIISQIKSFMVADPEAAKEPEAQVSVERVALDRQIRGILQSIEKISPLPATAQKALGMLDDPNVSLEHVGEVLSMDPGLTATLLRVVNSAFYGLRDKIGNVGKAAVVLGMKKLRQLVVAAAVMQKFQAVPPAFAQKFWESSMRTAQWSKELGENTGHAETDELFISGLLHNIGHLVIMQHFRPQQTLVDEMVTNGRKRYDSEKALLGGTHADVGGFLFSLWQLPKETVQSAMFHHHDFNLLSNSPNMTPTVFFVHMSAAICELDPNLDAYGYSEQLEKIAKRYAGPLKLGASLNIDKLAESVDTHFGQLMSSFSEW